MLYTIARQINWIDLFVVIVLFRIIYVAVNTGFIVEVFKFLGTAASVYLSFHYYSTLSAVVYRFVGFKNLPVGFFDLPVFIVLALSGYSVCIIFRKFISRLWKIDAVESWNKWLGIGLGLVRGILLVSLWVFMFTISSSAYLEKCVKDSLTGKSFFRVAPAVYSALWNGVGSKLSAKEKFNRDVIAVKEKIYR